MSYKKVAEPSRLTQESQDLNPINLIKNAMKRNPKIFQFPVSMQIWLVGHTFLPSLLIYFTKWCNLPTHNHQRVWAEKVVLAWTNPPPPPSNIFGWFTSAIF